MSTIASGCESTVLQPDGTLQYVADGKGINIYIIDTGVLRTAVDFYRRSAQEPSNVRG